MSTTLKIEYIPIKDIKPYKRNAKLHPQEQIDQIKASIKEFGFNDPIAVWHDNEIVAVLDIDSKELATFDETDKAWLEKITGLLYR